MAKYKELQPCVTEEHLPPHEEGGGSLLEIDGTIVFIAVSFIIFTVIMQKVFYKPLDDIREKRANRINTIKNEADSALEQAEKLSVEYTEKIKKARQLSSNNTNKTVAQANQEKTRILEERKQQVSEYLNSERKQILEEKNRSIESLKENIDNYADDIFSKVLGEETYVTIGETNE